jgi:glycosyltransferase involved in cell wall biosynthesis
MIWWIFEDALRNNVGHYFEYIKTFKRGLEAEGDTVRIFVDHKAEEWVLVSLGAEPRLPRSIWARTSDNAPRWKKLLRYPGHGCATYWSVSRLLRSPASEPPDVAFFPSVSTHHLVGLVPLLRQLAPHIPTKFLLFFPNVPICQDPMTGQAMLKADATAKWFPALLAFLRPLVEDGRVILGTETRSMQNALTTLCGLPFIYLPHPVEFDANAMPAQGSDQLLIGHYGSARHEKGSDLFQAASMIWLQRNPDANVHFIMQWLEDFHDNGGNLIQKDPKLVANSRFKFIDHYFDPNGGYLRQVAATNIMILPYREAYRFRLSRVVIETMLAGIPVVSSLSTTLHEQATEHGANIGIQMDSVESLVKGIDEAVNNYTQLVIKARDKTTDCSRHYSVSFFKKCLFTSM